ncbi:replication restart DNA helicase PriA [Sphaerotilus hippei]|uniref:Replication restart protein PriA n=1 Tax=Sphaerotilus hippei TaxID=744406 RepID=A0A318H0A7_9BURK|nr:primosomal protein N' [Sphaerotilus hippei]PXW94583.1 replication restart DNA helicase PriA [Sphaerotilus hippei]
MECTPETERVPPPEAGRCIVRVLVELPRHVGLHEALDYRCDRPLAPGTLVRVPLGRRVVTGLVEGMAEPTPACGQVVPPAEPERLRDVAEVFDALPPMTAGWMRLLDFAAAYYQRSRGELALSCLPTALRALDGVQLQRRLKKLARRADVAPEGATPQRPVLAPGQQQALQKLVEQAPSTFLLHGVTGSGKTEVYLREAQRVLEAGRQVLVLVPEINLTPQLEARFAARFPGRRLAVLHSGLTPPQRLQHWLAAHLGQADLVLGTRMAIFASLPRLGLIVVDEEHDPSYKQQEGARYSARDLAVYRGRQAGASVILGSATPSLESWLNAAPAAEGGGRYRRIDLPERIGGGALPAVRLVDLERVVAQHGRQALRLHPISPPLLAALRERLERGEQSMLLLNRRGYAPVLHCTSCGWKSACPHCSAWRVFHKVDRTLRCHHCGSGQRVPLACPECGDPDIQPMGRGTERLEEQLATLLPQARVVRIDGDTTRQSGSLESQLAQVHDGEVDVLVGTQMVAKGHDFRRMTLVAAVDADGALFSSDFRAPERLFALLMQAGGRAGRDAALAARSEMWVQTWHPAHPLFAALKGHDYIAFARSQLDERRIAAMPPFSAQALLRADASTQELAQAFLQRAEALAGELQAAGQVSAEVFLYPPVPTSVQRVADVERAQLLVEAPRRAQLQAFLAAWVPLLDDINRPPTRVIRWAVDVDPLSI